MGDILRNFQQVMHKVSGKQRDEIQMSMKPWNSSLLCSWLLLHSLHTI